MPDIPGYHVISARFQGAFEEDVVVRIGSNVQSFTGNHEPTATANHLHDLCDLMRLKVQDWPIQYFIILGKNFL